MAKGQRSSANGMKNYQVKNYQVKNYQTLSPDFPSCSYIYKILLHSVWFSTNSTSSRTASILLSSYFSMEAFFEAEAFDTKVSPLLA